MFDFSGLNVHAAKFLGLLRIVTGLLYMQHGTQKLLNFPAPPDHPVTLMSQMGIGGIFELFGGLLIVLGLFTRPVAFLLSGMMAVAFFQFHFALGANPFYPILNGGDLAVLFCFVYLYFVFSGPGAFAVDNILGRRGRY